MYVYSFIWLFCLSAQDSEDEDEYYNPKKKPPMDEGYAESQC